ncbi:YuiB family protein [Paenibacillus guangzhouensis]|uniref:YuiB family protein n=1 Tax=Paenibacillus guangzhouensis TaxID=1473112 RepID=UPI0012671291|nr:YuiB family protein [Paenibacillus guangzhouensis]
MDGVVGSIIPIILFVLFFVMMFGIGFILNMLMKTTWFPAYLFVIVIVPAVIISYWKKDLSFFGNIEAYSLVDLLTACAGLVGAIISGTTIRMLRRSGFKMF